jgi:predicted MPP superfamily phosphohydrolase
VHISDLQTVGACAREARAAQIINDLEPDLIVFCGDYIAGPLSHPGPAIAAARAFLGALHARDGLVCVAGHSETEDLRKRIFAGLDLRYLRDEVSRSISSAVVTCASSVRNAPSRPRRAARQSPSRTP